MERILRSRNGIRGKKRTPIVILAILVLLGVFLQSLYGYLRETVDDWKDMMFAQNLSPGINLGNSLDCYGLSKYEENALPEDFEVYWHNPPIHEEWFLGVKEAGFSSVRIPVSWGEHVDQENQIDDAWMDRVQEVVDMAFRAGLYVILDTHHEEWLVTDEDQEEQVTERLCDIWSQIGERFKDYDERLLFEGMNEPRLIGSNLEWTEGTPEMRRMVNRFNQAFVETVRALDGYNAERYLLLAGYSGSSKPEALFDIEIPEGDNVMVSIHDYFPYEFTKKKGGTDQFDSSDPYFWEKMDTLTKIFQDQFISQGVPVVLTEFCCNDKENHTERLEWTRVYAGVMKKSKIPYFWWDQGEGSRLFDRRTGEPEQEEIIKILVE